MLSFIITDTSGNEKNIKSAISVVLDQEIGVPADNLTVMFPYDSTISKNADFLTAFSGDEIIFKGKIDEITTFVRAKSAVTKISARSLAGILLDNEAEPVTYFRPSGEVVFNRHLKPYGITAGDTDAIPYYGTLKIKKGMSHWQVFEDFCNYRYGSVPRISGNGIAMFKGTENSRKINFGSGGIDYISIKESFLRCKLISKVMLRLSDGGAYSSYIENSNDECRGITRVRYVNAAANTSSINTADRIISNSNADSYSVKLECAGCYVDILGCKAEINDSFFGKVDGLVVNSIKYTSNSSGELTAIVLGKENV
jgi:hypothetical protein